MRPQSGVPLSNKKQVSIHAKYLVKDERRSIMMSASNTNNAIRMRNRTNEIASTQISNTGYVTMPMTSSSKFIT